MMLELWAICGFVMIGWILAYDSRPGAPWWEPPLELVACFILGPILLGFELHDNLKKHHSKRGKP